ncbi:MAG TPA: PRC-barrel domain-containing protein [Ignavibacteriaceae bacterium]|nr:PRC-barrel domain-containing protein [Ignavibacteriaceae bacterium]
MKIEDELIGKEVIDESGDVVGIVKDVEWDFKSKMVESIELKEGGISAKIGLGEKKIVPISMVDQIGDKVLIKGLLFK